MGGPWFAAPRLTLPFGQEKIGFRLFFQRFFACCSFWHASYSCVERRKFPYFLCTVAKTKVPKSISGRHENTFLCNFRLSYSWHCFLHTSHSLPLLTYMHLVGCHWRGLGGNFAPWKLQRNGRKKEREKEGTRMISLEFLLFYCHGLSCLSAVPERLAWATSIFYHFDICRGFLRS